MYKNGFGNYKLQWLMCLKIKPKQTKILTKIYELGVKRVKTQPASTEFKLGFPLCLSVDKTCCMALRFSQKIKSAIRG